MGNLLAGTHSATTFTGSDRNNSHDDRRRSGLPTAHYHDPTSPIRNFMHDWEHSKNEIFFLTYRAVQGAFFGGIIGMMMVPMMKHSPYVYRKAMMSIGHNDLFPVDTAKLFLRIIGPYYMTIGAVTFTANAFLSELYDRVISSNKFTKYGWLGALEGALFFALLGPTGTWTKGFLAGLIGGLSGCAMRGRINLKSHGDYGRSVEYMNHVTSDDKKRFEMQEARIMGHHPR